MFLLDCKRVLNIFESLRNKRCINKKMSSSSIFIHNTFSKYPDPCAKDFARCCKKYTKTNVGAYPFKCSDKYERCMDASKKKSVSTSNLVDK